MTSRFSDVSREMYDVAYIEAVAHKDLVLGDGGKFNPDMYITREEIALKI